MCSVNFWDLSGHPEFFEVRNEFYKDTQGGILVFDVSSRASFEALDNWLLEGMKFGLRENAVVMVVANKSDKKRVVTERDGKAWADKNGFGYCECSAKSGKNVEPMFDRLFK